MVFLLVDWVAYAAMLGAIGAMLRWVCTDPASADRVLLSIPGGP